MTYDIRYDKLQKALIDARHAAGMTQAEVAARLNKPQSFVSKYEMGERKLDIIELIDIAKIFNVETEKIILELTKSNTYNQETTGHD